MEAAWQASRTHIQTRNHAGFPLVIFWRRAQVLQPLSLSRSGSSRAKQCTFRQWLLSFARPQWRICATLKSLAPARRLVKAEQALADLVNAGRGLWQRPPFASRDHHLHSGRGALDIRHVAAPN